MVVISDVRFGSIPASEYTTWRATGFGQKQTVERSIRPMPQAENPS